MNQSTIPLSLYVHWPWCVQKCPYCDFNSHTSGRELVSAYSNALLTDWQRQYAVLGAQRPIRSIFFGGGTPSLAPPEVIAQMIEQVAKVAGVTEDVEITLEANPGTVDLANFAGYFSAGVNRLSLGVQSFDDGLLQKIGRIHDSRQVLQAIEVAHRVGFRRLNLDLMTGLPSQTMAQALTDIDTAIAISPEHLSLYQLTLEPNTSFFARPPVGLPDDDLADDLQMAVHERARAGGYQQYEVSAWAKSAKQRSQHNLNYWQFGDYLGVGAGAHGKITLASGGIQRTHTAKTPQAYLNAVQASVQTQYLGASVIAEDDLPFEFLLNALRLTDGVDSRLFGDRTGLPLSVLTQRWDSLVQEGLLVELTQGIRATDHGYRHLNAVLAKWLD